MLKRAVPSAPISRIQSGRYISVPRAFVMSPRSMIASAGQPKTLQQLAHLCLRFLLVPADEEGRARDRVDHDRRVDCVERLHNPGLRKGALDLLTEAVVADEESRRPSPGEVQREGDVD